jgi:hypothetical protein
MSDIRKIEHELLAELKTRGIAMTRGVKRQVHETAADAVLVERARAAINDGQPLDLDGFMKLKQAAEQSRIALLGESSAVGAVTRLEVELIPSRHTEAERHELRAENERLRQRLLALESAGNPRGATEAAGAISGPPSVPQPSPSADSCTASPSPNSENVVPPIRSIRAPATIRKILPDGTKSGNWLNNGDDVARRVPRAP